MLLTNLVDPFRFLSTRGQKSKCHHSEQIRISDPRITHTHTLLMKHGNGREIRCMLWKDSMLRMVFTWLRKYSFLVLETKHVFQRLWKFTLKDITISQNSLFADRSEVIFYSYLNVLYQNACQSRGLLFCIRNGTNIGNIERFVAPSKEVYS